jgi:hypothetical protein
MLARLRPVPDIENYGFHLDCPLAHIERPGNRREADGVNPTNSIGLRRTCLADQQKGMILVVPSYLSLHPSGFSRRVRRGGTAVPPGHAEGQAEGEKE